MFNPHFIIIDLQQLRLLHCNIYSIYSCYSVGFNVLCSFLGSKLKSMQKKKKVFHTVCTEFIKYDR